MISNAPRRVGIAAIITLLAATSDAFAGVPPAVGGTVVYGPLAESIPALSGTMLIVLGLLFSILTYRVLRTSSGGRPLASLVAMSIAGLAGVSGTNLIQDAKAFVGYSMSPAGGSIHVDGGSEYPIFNGTGRKQQIKSVTPDSSCMVGTPSSPACTPGGVVQPDASCNVRFDCNPV